MARGKLIVVAPPPPPQKKKKKKKKKNLQFVYLVYRTSLYIIRFVKPQLVPLEGRFGILGILGKYGKSYIFYPNGKGLAQLKIFPFVFGALMNITANH